MDEVQYRMTALLDGVVHITMTKLSTAFTVEDREALLAIVSEATQAKGRIAPNFPTDQEANCALSIGNIYRVIHSERVGYYEGAKCYLSTLPGNPTTGTGVFLVDPSVNTTTGIS